MKYNLAQKVTNYDGSEIDKTYKDVIVIALNGVLADEIVPAEKKARIFELTKKIYASDTPNLTDPEVLLIMERAGNVLKSPLAFGRLKEFFTKSSIIIP